MSHLRFEDSTSKPEQESGPAINRVLYWVVRWPGGKLGAGLCRDVLRQTRRERGRSPDFALLADRIGIGQTLIHMLP